MLEMERDPHLMQSPCLTNEETEAQRGLMTYPRSQQALINDFALINAQVYYIPGWEESTVKVNIFSKFRYGIHTTPIKVAKGLFTNNPTKSF